MNAAPDSRLWRWAAAAAACVALAAPRAGLADAIADARAAGVPADLVREVAARARERGAGLEEALAPVAEAARHGVPADLVAAKVLEGLAKGVPPPRVIAVARALSDRLQEADALLVSAGEVGLTRPVDRRAALADLAGALGHGVRRADVEDLVAAAHGAQGGQSDAVVAAAQTVGELARRGVPPGESLSLGRALAKGPARQPGEVAALFEAYVAEGGKDPHAFLEEATRRVAAGRKLDGMVDRFAESPDRVNRDRAANPGNDGRGAAGSDVGRKGADKGLAPAERSDAARAAVPGLDDAVRGRARATTDAEKPKR